MLIEKEIKSSKERKIWLLGAFLKDQNKKEGYQDVPI